MITEQIQKKLSKQLVGRILLLTGIVIVAVGVGYEIFNLPWTAYFQKWGWMETPSDLPNPDSIGAEWLDMNQLPALDPEMPEQEKRFITKGEIRLELLGYLKIPKLGLSENVVEGAGEELCYAIGHIPGTSAPGRTGNSVLGGHRNYVPMHPFRNLDQLSVDDDVYFEDQNNRYLFKVFDIFDVDPSQVEVLEPIEGEACVLTLLTCTPASTMTRRLIVQARLTGTEPIRMTADPSVQET